MKLSRRQFLAATGATAAGSFLSKLFGISEAQTAQPLQVTYERETYSLCPYCAVGCGLIIQTENGRVVNIEGDPDHPISQGALCSKGNALLQMVNSPRRLSTVLYRAPHSLQWQEKDLNWALRELVQRIKNTRDAHFFADEDGATVNRTEAIACLGGVNLTNEECYLFSKLSRALGVVYLEHQARLCHSSTVTALASSFGRGAMTNHWIDLKNSDCIFIIGCNPAENHPVSFRWITMAKERGATLIVADPRFTRSASKADLYLPIRPGTDIALIGGLIHYALSRGLYHEEYFRHYTDASFLVNPFFDFENGLFSGFDLEKKLYDPGTWDYQRDEEGQPIRDLTLSEPQSVFQLLKRHYARYTPEKVCQITGLSQEKFLELARAFCSTSHPQKAGTILYAMGATQHTVGVEYIRSYALLQLLLGNMGRPGGGINALRGASNVQGSTDMALLFDLLPGYLKLPQAKEHPTLAEYLKKETPQDSYWKNKPKFFISLLKAYWGEWATEDRAFCYDYLPKRGKGFQEAGYSWIPLFEAMASGQIKGMVVFGQNPVGGGPNSGKESQAMENLEWLAVFDIWETETPTFWKRPGAKPETINTEVFLFPSAAFCEREGSITNSGRWIQWRYKAVEPRGDVRSDLWYLNRLALELKEIYRKDSKAAFPEPILHLNWSYGDEEPDAHLVAKEINGYTWPDREQVANFTQLKDDGTTACGNWVMSGIYPGSEPSDNLMARRGLVDEGSLGLYPQWAYAWPLNRRILYNRCNISPEGKPWDETRALFFWHQEDGRWTLMDVPDFAVKEPQSGRVLPPEASASGPFIMLSEGKGRLFIPKGMTREGPFPEHYEPFESPVGNLLSSQRANPVIKVWEEGGDPSSYPIIATTFRLTEHWQTGPMTRNLPYLTEMMPEMLVEMSPSLARDRGIENGDWVRVKSQRGQVLARACITERIKPFPLNGKKYEMVALPWCFGYAGYSTGGPDSQSNYAANQLTAHVGDANTMIPEYKVFLCQVEKVHGSKR